MSESDPVNVVVHETPDELAQAAADLVLDALRARRSRLLLAGGATPHRAYQLIGQQATAPDYKGAHIFFADERMVPVDHFESNYGAIKRAWLEPTRFPTERVHRILAEVPADRAARLADDDLRSVTGEPPRLDLALLGLGTDGHTAALFPGSDELDETDRLFIPARNETRVTASLTLLAHCDQVVFLVSGMNKAEAVRSALLDPPGAVPASLIGTTDRPPLWLLDRAAASQLGLIT